MYHKPNQAHKPSLPLVLGSSPGFPGYALKAGAKLKQKRTLREDAHVVSVWFLFERSRVFTASRCRAMKFLRNFISTLDACRREACTSK